MLDFFFFIPNSIIKITFYFFVNTLIGNNSNFSSFFLDSNSLKNSCYYILSITNFAFYIIDFTFYFLDTLLIFYNGIFQRQVKALTNISRVSIKVILAKAFTKVDLIEIFTKVGLAKAFIEVAPQV